MQDAEQSKITWLVQTAGENCSLCGGTFSPLVFALGGESADLAQGLCVDCLVGALEVGTGFGWRNQYRQWQAVREVHAGLAQLRKAEKTAERAARRSKK